MIIEPQILSNRRALLSFTEANILLNLMKYSSKIVRYATLDTLTHLPLSEQAWVQVVEQISHEFQRATTLWDKALLLELLTWIPLENEVRRIESDPLEQRQLLDTLEIIMSQYEYLFQEDYDREWANKLAPGFMLFSESELLTQKSKLNPQIPITASDLSNWSWYNESPPDIPIEDPVLVTLLFELAGKDDYHDVNLINSLLKNLQWTNNFRPDLNGLFKQYFECVKVFFQEGSPYFESRDGQYYNSPIHWFMRKRFDEDSYSWRSWQIAWTVSRGGLTGLISALENRLTSNAELRQLTALGLIADSADYVLQRSAPLFGGGRRPYRTPPKEGLLYIPETIDDEEFVQLRLDSAVPESVIVDQPFDLAVAIRQLMSKILDEPDLTRIEHGEVQINWPFSQNVVGLIIKVQAPDCEILDSNQVAFKLRKGHDSPTFYFKLTPRKIGEIIIIVTVYQEIYSLGSARVKTQASIEIVGEATTTVYSQAINRNPLTRLRQNLDQYFSLGELHGLCFDLKIDREYFPPTKPEFIAEFLLYCERHNRLDDLIQELNKTRTAVTWDLEEPTP